jgi:nitrogen fixation protein FixH
MKRLGYAILPILIPLLLNGCGPTASPAADTQTSGSLSATLQVSPFPPAPMEDTTLELTLRDSNQRPVTGALVVFDLTMPAMEMPVNRPQATEEESGVYRTNAIFTMAGEWLVRVEVTYQGQDEEFRFPLHTR